MAVRCGADWGFGSLDGGSGSTATGVLVRRDAVVCANVGDSHVVLSRGGRAVELTVEHRLSGERPSTAEEVRRIEQVGWGGSGQGFDNTGRDRGHAATVHCASIQDCLVRLPGCHTCVCCLRRAAARHAPRHVGPPPQVGGWVTDGRVCGILAVSRAFGDREYKGEGLQHLLERGVASGRWTAEFAAGRCVAEGREVWCVARHGRCPAATVDLGWEGRGS